MQNIFSVEGLISWLETQPAGTPYDYTDLKAGGDCLIGRYFRARGLPVYLVGSCTWSTTDGKDHTLCPELDYVSRGPSRTYGGALKRARELLAA